MRILSHGKSLTTTTLLGAAHPEWLCSHELRLNNHWIIRCPVQEGPKLPPPAEETEVLWSVLCSGLSVTVFFFTLVSAEPWAVV